MTGRNNDTIVVVVVVVVIVLLHGVITLDLIFSFLLGDTWTLCGISFMVPITVTCVLDLVTSTSRKQSLQLQGNNLEVSSTRMRGAYDSWNLLCGICCVEPGRTRAGFTQC